MKKDFTLALRFALGLFYLAAIQHSLGQNEPVYSWKTFVGKPGVFGYADGTGINATFGSPRRLAMDGSGNIFVTDSSYHTIRKVTPLGGVSTFAGLAGTHGTSDGTGNAARFYRPRGIAVDKSGNLLVADYSNNTIRKVTPAGAVTTFAGMAGSIGSADGVGSAARFYAPSGLTIDGSDNIYIADYLNHTIRKITPTGIVTTVAGTAGTPGSADGSASTARFNRVSGITVDGSGNLYVADTYNHTIRKVNTAGVVTTLAGTAGFSGSVDGIGSEARFKYPFDVFADNSGNVFVADSQNYTIRKITSTGVVTTIGGVAGSKGSNDGIGNAARFYDTNCVFADTSGTL